jgi:hypothetical protein
MSCQRLAVWICAGAALWSAAALADGYAPRIGEPHPDLTLPMLGDHRPVSLSQLRGRKVLLIHFASW